MSTPTVNVPPFNVSHKLDVAPIDMSVYLAIFFICLTGFIQHFFNSTDDQNFRASSARVMRAFFFVLWVINLFMAGYRCNFPISEENFTGHLPVIRSTFRKVNSVGYDFVIYSFTDSSYYMYMGLVLALFCVFSNDFCNEWIRSPLEYVGREFYHKFEPESLELDRFCQLYTKDKFNQVQARHDILLVYIQRTILFVWVIFTTHAFVAYEFASSDAVKAMFLLTVQAVLHPDIYFGIWNPVTLFYDVSGAVSRREISIKHVLTVFVMVCSICNTSLSIKCFDWWNDKLSTTMDASSVVKYWHLAAMIVPGLPFC